MKRTVFQKNSGWIRLSLLVLILVGGLVGLLPKTRFERQTSETPGPNYEFSGCVWEGDAPSASLGAMPAAQTISSLTAVPNVDVSPIRCISDPYPEFNGLTVDPINNEVLASDGNVKSLLVYDRRAGGKSLGETEPLRLIHGPRTGIGYVAGVAIDPVKREYYTVNNDVEDRLVVFTRDAEGNALPTRVLYTPHQVYGLALDPTGDEMAITVQELNAVLVYRKQAKGLDAPLRVILGPNTGMADPRGVFIDAVNNEIIVANHGNYHDEARRFPYAEREIPLLPSAGRYQAPSITFFARTAEGDQTPLRTIQGPNTQLAWPMGIHADTINNEIAIANNADNSILIFRRSDRSDAQPARVIRGSDTNLSRPMGVYIDHKNDELWVANFGNHSINVYPRTAKGNVAPNRILRGAPEGTPVVGFGNPMAIAYNAVRQEILVPN